MRIKSCRIEAFGGIEDFSLPDLDHQAVVLLGPNEAGKSTLFEFLKTMLFGIYPTLADNHPYAPWSGRRLQGQLSFITSAGKEMTVARRLLSSPDGSLLNGGRDSIRNQTVPAAAHISRELFDAVYALSLGDMTSLRERPWEEVQERLLGSFAMDRFKPVSAVLKQIEADAGALWRESSRGKQKSRKLEARIVELRKKAREAEGRDREVRSLDREIALLRLRSDELEEAKKVARQERDRLSRLLPVQSLLEKIQAHRSTAGAFESFRHLPPNLPQHLAERRRTCERLQQEAEQKAERREALSRRLPLEPHDERLLEVEGEIRTWLKERGRLQELKGRWAGIQEELEETEFGIAETKRKISPAGWTETSEQRLRRLSIERLRRNLEGFHSLRTEREQRSASIETEKENPLGIILAGTACLSGIFFSLLALMEQYDYLLIPSVILTATGATSFLYQRWALRQRREARRQRVREIETKLAQARRELAADLDFPPFEQISPERVDAQLLTELQTLQSRLCSRELLGEKAQSASERIRQFEAELREWTETRRLQVAGSVEEILDQLETRLAEVQERERQSEAASAEIQGIDQRLGELREQLSREQADLEEIEALILKAGRGSHERGLQQIAERREAFERAERFQRVLEEQHPEWEHSRVEIKSGGAEEISPARLAAIQEELESIEEELKQISTLEASQNQKLQQLQLHPSVSDIEGEITFEESRLEEIRFERDRLALLAEIVRRGEQEFRERHQPDVLRRAGHYLNQVSSDRYHRLDFSDDDKILQVFPTEPAHPVPVAPPLSSGTRDQIFLSLRLALVDHLDEGHEVLPLFLDEIFVNWDKGRRRSGFRILETMLAVRQILFFTCHEWFADEARERIGARVVSF